MIASKLLCTADLVNFWSALIDRETLKGITVFLFYLHVIFVNLVMNLMFSHFVIFLFSFSW